MKIDFKKSMVGRTNVTIPESATAEELRALVPELLNRGTTTSPPPPAAASEFQETFLYIISLSLFGSNLVRSSMFRSRVTRS